MHKYPARWTPRRIREALDFYQRGAVDAEARGAPQKAAKYRKWANEFAVDLLNMEKGVELPSWIHRFTRQLSDEEGQALIDCVVEWMRGKS